MPIIFTFMLATFPAGLVIYWTWNNMLSIAQQWLIMRRMGVKPGDRRRPDRRRRPGRPSRPAAWLFAQECRFVAGTATLDQLPPPGLPEVAFAGRSNVGKSSLINALTGRKHLARVSNTPGRTQQINFFDLGGRLMLVDLPGYGFAQGRPRPRSRAGPGWSIAYLRGRPNLRRVLLLVDAAPRPQGRRRRR